ncbi:ty3-gypsy retrotransposon protein [Tanacetum coccineum]
MLTAVWEDVSMDFITGMPLSKGFSVVLVVVDRFSKYAHFATLPTSFNAPKVAEVFVEAVVKHHGIPKTIVSDRDPIFVSKFLDIAFKLSVHLSFHAIACSLSTLRFLKIRENRFEVLKVPKNSLEVLKVLKLR